jgi:hypothetical protein
MIGRSPGNAENLDRNFDRCALTFDERQRRQWTDICRVWLKSRVRVTDTRFDLFKWNQAKGR